MILDEIVAKRKEFYKEKEKEISLDNLLVQIGSIKKEHKLYELCKEKNFILFTECKKASPSKGIISNDYSYLEIAKAYEKAGTDVISCLTEPTLPIYVNNAITIFAKVVIQIKKNVPNVILFQKMDNGIN